MLSKIELVIFPPTNSQWQCPQLFRWLLFLSLPYKDSTPQKLHVFLLQPGLQRYLILGSFVQHCLPPAQYMFYRHEHANDLGFRGEMGKVLRFGEGEE